MNLERMTVEQENEIVHKLAAIADDLGIVTAKELRNAGFAEWVATLLSKDVGYEDALQNRVLQTLRNKNRITMNNGIYILAN